MKKDKNMRVLRNRGAAVMIAVIFFVFISATVAIGLSSSVVREYVGARDFEKSKGAYYLSEAGQEDAIYRIKKILPISTQEVLLLGGNTATTTITSVNPSLKTLASIGDILRNTRRVKSSITTTTGESFVYGVWAGAGGVALSNSSSITGNLFSGGSVCGGGGTGATCTGGTGTNLITGTVISTGTTGSNGTISNIQNQAGNSMNSATIKNSTISGTASCNTISGSSTSTCQTFVPQTPAPLPITAQDIANWETAAASGGTATCVGGQYNITTSVNIGPKKIPCDLYITGNGSAPGPTITLQGPLWVTGNIIIKKFLTIRVDPTFTGQSIVMIADNPANRTTSSKILVEDNNSTFAGAPGGNSWVMLLSENTGASTGSAPEAIELENGANGAVLLYARLGDIIVKDNASVAGITGYKITLQNSANVVYSTGLQNTLFTSGPGGAWAVQDWKEGQ